MLLVESFGFNAESLRSGTGAGSGMCVPAGFSHADVGVGSTLVCAALLHGHCWLQLVLVLCVSVSVCGCFVGCVLCGQFVW